LGENLGQTGDHAAKSNEILPLLPLTLLNVVHEEVSIQLSASADHSKPNQKERVMKKSLALVAGVVLLSAVTALRTFAANESVTITGEAKCAKCALKEAKECQTVIQTEKDGKTVIYYLADNEASKPFQKQVCEQSKKVTATGTVKEVNGKMELAAIKIEEAK